VDQTFESRVRAAAAAAWWTLLVSAVFFLCQWLIFLRVMSAKPGWVMAFWGPGATWESIAAVWFQALVLLKLTLWPLALGALWLTFWARQLRKRRGAA